MTQKPGVSTTESDPRPQSERSAATLRCTGIRATRDPAAPACPCCGVAQAEQALDPADPGRPEPGETPCPSCTEQMKKGILLIEVEDWGGGPPDEPRRTGRVACVDEAGIRRCVRPPELVEHTLRQRFAYVSQAAWKSFGLARVREGVN